MSELPGKRTQQKLTRWKKEVKAAYEYFKPNYDRFNEFKRFVFDTSLNDDDITLLMTMGRPQLEFNVLEAYVSRLLGEFSKQEPSIEVHAEDDANVDPQTIELVQDHLQHAINESDMENMRYEVYKDLLAGGFSVIKVFTDYKNPMSMKQDIFLERPFDPTMCGFDQFAKEKHKGDGKFCFELYPMTKEEFEELYPDVDTDSVSFSRTLEGFNWSYLNLNKEMLIVCDYYEKKSKEIKIVQVRDGRVMPYDEYQKMVAEWPDPGTVAPAIVGKPRTTKIEKIWRHRFIENQVISSEETEFNMLPLVFVDGNSIMLRAPKNGNVRQMTRPYVYHGKGAQKLMNFAGISLANAIENEVQHKFMVAKEALPKEEEFLQAYKEPQKASTLVYNSVHENNPEMPILNPISPVPKIPAPPEIMQAWQNSVPLIQSILGDFDPRMSGANTNAISGIAIVEASTQNNSAAMPYIVGFMQGLERAAQIYVEMIPKYWVTPRTIPMRNAKGERYYIPINQQPDQKTFDYEENALNVSIKAGASFQVQKSRTIMMIKEMMGMSPLFQQFIAEKGLDFVLDNMEGKGIEQLKQMVDGFVQELQQQKQQAMQMQQQEAQANSQNPAMMRAQVDMQKLQLEQQKMQMEHQIDMLKLEVEHNKIDADLHMSARKDAMEIHKAELDNHDRFHDKILKATEIDNKHVIEHKKLEHAAKDKAKPKNKKE